MMMMILKAWVVHRLIISFMALSLLLITPSESDASLYNSQLTFEHSEYTPYDAALIRLYDPDMNDDRRSTEIVNVQVSATSSKTPITVTLTETGSDTSLFEGTINLSILNAKRDDVITATFTKSQSEDDDNDDDDESSTSEEEREEARQQEEDTDDMIVTTQTILIYHHASLYFDKAIYTPEFGTNAIIDPSYESEQSDAKLTLYDLDLNERPYIRDAITVRVWSDTDTNGILLELVERESEYSYQTQRTVDYGGLFEGEMVYTKLRESSGSTLKVREGDRIYAQHYDDTLPYPKELNADGITTTERERLDAVSRISALGFGDYAAPVTKLLFTDGSGKAIAGAKVGEQIVIQSEITNIQNREESFVYIMQVADENGFAVSLSWILADLTGRLTIPISQSWVPSESGSYNVQIFVWSDINNPTILGPAISNSIHVSGGE